jgi:hypothetical protein
MSTRAELVARWESQLLTSEARFESAPPRLRWLWKMRARLYRFLLLCYGDTAWTAPVELEHSDPRASGQRPLIDNRADAVGLSPKSAERIRSTLKSVRAANDRADAPGPYADGRFHCEWIRLATFNDKAESVPLIGELQNAGLSFRRQSVSWRYVAVEVQRCDFDEGLDYVQRVRPLLALYRATRGLRRQAWVLLIQAVIFALFGAGMLVSGLLATNSTAGACYGAAAACILIACLTVHYRSRLLLDGRRVNEHIIAGGRIGCGRRTGGLR